MLTAKTVRRWYRVHKWTSLICTLFLLMSCLTGLPLIFHDEIDDLLDHHVAPAQVPPDTPLTSLDSIVEAGKQHYPKEVPMFFGWSEDEARVLLTMAPALDAPPSKYHELRFDSHTGALLDESKVEDDVMSWVLTLHEELFAGLPGGLFMGLMALLFVVAIVSGGVVYGPFMRKLNFGTVRKDSPRQVQWLDLHNLLGIVTLLWATVVGVTGVMNALSGPLFGLWRAQELPRLLAPYEGKPMPEHLNSVDKALHDVRQLLPNAKITGFVFPDPNFSSPRHYVIWTKGNTPLTSRLFTPVLVDVETGQLIKPHGLPWYLRALEVSRPLHFGDYGGMPLKILWALLDLITIIVLVSGLYLWIAHRRAPVEKELDALVELETADARQIA